MHPTKVSLLVVVTLLVGVLAAGCSTTSAPVPSPTPARGEAVGAALEPFLVEPLEGFPLVAAPEPADRVTRAHRRLVTSGDAGAARTVAEELLALDPGFQPAIVLAAQADLVAGDPATVVERLRPLAAELPRYTAALLLLGRAAEEVGDVADAYAAFASVADSSPVAAERAEVLHERAVEIVARRVDDALRRQRLDLAEAELERLRAWAPDALATLEATAALARERDVPGRELAAVEALLERIPDDPDLLGRRAELDLRVGDRARGLQTLRDLAATAPDDPELAARVARAEFLYRLSLLPERVQELESRAVLTRSELATLLFWGVPGVRTTSGDRGSGRIAVDILEHPRRREIVRVVNHGLMDVDSTVHTFEPERPARRADALRALLRALERPGVDAACLASAPLGARPTTGRVCAAASRCGLVDEEASCLPSSRLSGREAVELLRRASALFAG